MGALLQGRQSFDVPSTSKHPFIVTVAPGLLHGLTPRACRLFMTLLRRADGHTGELKIPGRKWNKAESVWLKATQFDREANMSKPTRMKAMRELIARGLVTVARPRVHRVIGGRMRAVAGPTQYTVHRTPANTRTHHERPTKSSKVKGVPVFQKSNSSIVEKVDPEVLSTTPPIAPPAETRFEVEVGFHGWNGGASSSSPPVKIDDDDSLLTHKSSFKDKTRTNQQTLDPALRAWMKTQILARAPSPVNSRSAYLRASYPAFLGHLGEEIESYLQSKAEKFMMELIAKKGSVDCWSVEDFLEEETEKHALPIGLWTEDGQESEEFSVTRECPGSVYGRIYDNASEVLGLRDVSE